MAKSSQIMNVNPTMKMYLFVRCYLSPKTVQGIVQHGDKNDPGSANSFYFITIVQIELLMTSAL